MPQTDIHRNTINAQFSPYDLEILIVKFERKNGPSEEVGNFVQNILKPFLMTKTAEKKEYYRHLKKFKKKRVRGVKRASSFNTVTG